MRLNGIQCDGCGKQHLFKPTLLLPSIPEVLPDSWLLVQAGRYAPDKEPLAFCSKLCCHRWSGRELTAQDMQEV